MKPTGVLNPTIDDLDMTVLEESTNVLTVLASNIRLRTDNPYSDLSVARTHLDALAIDQAAALWYMNDEHRLRIRLASDHDELNETFSIDVSVFIFYTFLRVLSEYIVFAVDGQPLELHCIAGKEISIVLLR